MILIKLICAYGILLSITFFVMVNVETLGVTSGLVFLATALVSFSALFVVSGEFRSLIKIKRSMLLLILFLFYFISKLLLEASNIEEVKGYTIGTTGGVLFALVIGVMCAYALSTLYDLRTINVTKKLVYFSAFAYLILVLLLGLRLLQSHLAEVQSDIFLIEEQRGLYQRVGSLLFIQYMIVVSLVTTILISSSRLSVLTSLPFLILVVSLSVIYGGISQLVGSNSGLVSSVVFAIVFLVNIFLIGKQNPLRNRTDIKFTTILFGRMGVKLLFGGFISIVLIGAVVFIVIEQTGFDIDSFRITGFGNRESSSVESRSEFFRENFINHFAYSPVFGNTQVDKLTTGPGTYVHSLLSLLTHLGIFGSLLFVFFIYSIYLEITRSGNAKSNSLYNNSQYGLFRLLALGSFIMMNLDSAFFTWMPLWFALGLYGDLLVKRTASKRRKRVRSRRRVS